MATQIGAVTGNPFLAPDQLTQLRRRQAMFPAMLAAEQERKFQAQNIREQKRDRKATQSQAKKKMQLERELASKQMGVEALKLGTTFATSEVGGDLIKGVASSFSSAPKVGGAKAGFEPGATGYATGDSPMKGSSIFSGLSGAGGIKGALTGGLAGIGIGSLLGGGKTARLLGGLAGGLLGGGLGSGLIGGLFSSLFGGGKSA